MIKEYLEYLLGFVIVLVFLIAMTAGVAFATTILASPILLIIAVLYYYVL